MNTKKLITPNTRTVYKISKSCKIPVIDIFKLLRKYSDQNWMLDLTEMTLDIDLSKVKNKKDLDTLKSILENI